MIDPVQLRDVIVSPTLAALGMHSPNAMRLILGTIAQESQMGLYLVQQGIGFKGGIGICQMERPTYQSLWTNVIDKSIALRSKFKLFLGYEVKPPAERMASDLMLAVAMARIFYYAIPAVIPDDLEGIAAYYKKYYNTDLGKATTEEFIKNYNKFVK